MNDSPATIKRVDTRHIGIKVDH